jgi:hypothetical protein
LDYAALLERVPVAEAHAFHMPADVPPWTDTGLELRPGDAITLLASGEIEWAPGSGLRADAAFHLWGRLGTEGPVFSLPRGTRTLTAERGGRLFLAIYQGEWADPSGALATPVEAYALQKGAIDVAVLRWRGDAREGLDALCAAASDDTLLAAERERLRAPVLRPPGWEYLWFLGERDIFSQGSERSIRVDARAEAGILQKPAEIDLDASTQISWRWRVDELPSGVAEDSMPTHDYVSVAAEFDDGLDLTWYWSAALPAETHYTCPLPTWAARETHLVVRSGADGLGEWHAESRPLLEDYRSAIGAAEPRRIVAVWLIAVSLFQRGRARAEFADIELRRGDEFVRVT